MSCCDHAIVPLWLALLTLSSLPIPAQAQIVPDTTLGPGNNSVVNTHGIRTDITGGLQRNSSLFHSFDQFNVGTNLQVYFANPVNVRNIFSRVTGKSLSNIDGLLGVSGNANLYVINPNGIIFGPNARLDVAGSFLATTANALEFPGNERFEATGNRQVPLVEVNIPIGLQMGTNAPAMIANQGNLTAGQNLSLLASGSLTNNGQLVATQGNLTLTAQQIVKMRDSATQPVRLIAGNDLAIQGNQGIDILALNHPDNLFQSGGNFSLISDGNISGDAHFYSGGNFSILNLSGIPGDFVSLYDPIVRANGNVTFGAYDGLSLLVEAKGSITATGTIKITGPECPTGPAGCAISSSNVTPQDFTTLTTRAALILRAGLQNLSGPADTLPKTIGTTTFNANGNGGKDISVQNIDAGSSTPAGQVVGQIVLDAPGKIILTGTTIAANGGTIDFKGKVELRQSVVLSGSTTKFEDTVTTNNNNNSLAVSGNAIFQESVGASGPFINAIDISGTATLNGDINTAGPQRYQGAVLVGKDTALQAVSNSGREDITFGGTINSLSSVTTQPSLSIEKGKIVQFNGDIGNVAPLLKLSVNATELVIKSALVQTLDAQDYNTPITVQANQTIFSAGDIEFRKDVTGTGTNRLVVEPADPAGSIALAGNTGNLKLSLNELQRFVAFDQVTIGKINGTGTTTIANKIDLTGQPYNLTLRGGPLDFRNQLILDAGKNLDIRNSSVVNNSTVPAVTTSGGGTISFNLTGNVATQAKPLTIDGVLGSSNVNGQLHLASDQAITQKVGSSIVVSGATSLTSTLAGAGNVDLRSDTNTLTFGGNSTIGGNFNLTLNSTATQVSQTNGSSLKIAGTFTPNPSGLLLNLNQPNNILPRTISGNVLGGNVVILDSGPVNLTTDPLDPLLLSSILLPPSVANLTVQTVARSQQFNAPARTSATGIALNQAGNSFGGPLTLNTDSPGLTNLPTPLQPSITQSGATGITVLGKATFSATTAGNVTLNHANIFGVDNFFGSLSFVGNDVNISQFNSMQLDTSVAAGALNLFSGGAISQLGALTKTSTTTPVNITSTGAITLDNPANQVRGLINLINSNSGGDVVFTNTGDTQLGNLAINGNFTVNSGSITANNPISLDGKNVILLATTGDLTTKRISTSGSSGANGGNVQLQGNNVSVTGGINTTAGGAGNGGNVQISGISSVTLASSSSTVLDGGIDAAAFGTGKTGNTTIVASNGNVTLKNGTLFFDVFDGSSGDVQIQALGNNHSLLLDNFNIVGTVRLGTTTNPGGTATLIGSKIKISNTSRVAVDTLGAGAGGNLILGDVNTQEIEISGKDTILANTVGQSASGTGGNINVQANKISILDGATIDASTASTSTSGTGGNITLNGKNITINSSASNTTTLSALTSGAAAGGIVQIAATDNLTLQGVKIDSATTGSGNGGLISILGTSSIANLLLDNTQINATTNGSGNGGSVSIASNNSLTLKNNTQINATTSGSGAGGRIALSGNTVTLTDPGTVLQTDTSGSGKGGDIAVTGQTIAVNNLKIRSTVSGSGNGGTVQLGDITGNSGIITNTLNVTNTQIDTNVASGATGRGANVVLQGRNLTLAAGVDVNATTASTAQSGIGGSINVAGDVVKITGQNTQLVTNTTGAAAGGNVTVTGRSITLDQQASIQANVSGSGNGGTVQLGDTNTDQVTIDSSTISTNVAAGGTGQGANVTVLGRNIRLANQAKIQGNIAGNSRGGQVQIGDDNTVSLTLNNSTIETKVVSGGVGQGGQVALRGNALTLDQSTINAEIENGGSGQGSSINIAGGNLTVKNQSTVSARTAASNSIAGNITVSAQGTLDVLNSAIEASTTDTAANAIAGNLSVSALGNLTLNQSRIVTSATASGAQAGNVTLGGQRITVQASDVITSSQQGGAGNIQVVAQNLDLDRGVLKAENGSGAGGKSGGISLTVAGALTMANESLISTVGLNGANGGNISILKVRFASASPATGPNGSDIVARAEGGGAGGQILFQPKLVQGFEIQPAVPGNGTNDIDSNGDVNATLTSVDVIRGLYTPVIVFTDTSKIQSNACESAGSKAETTSELRIAGQGGVVASPTTPLSAQSTHSDWVAIGSNSPTPVSETVPDNSTVARQTELAYRPPAVCVSAWKGRYEPLQQSGRSQP
ncbi:MAG: filamentous hemagglutinin N-terminal domain-containing protein [Scytolyngbya sp. HA4215-MV1]|jgi:filamentous hemagglutinin family protein|nr:filamentous hemagglutinin N-terminal domain-containing protein [Scytolyngbya sp. HA4215-MV1]